MILAHNITLLVHKVLIITTFTVPALMHRVLTHITNRQDYEDSLYPL